MIILFFIDAFPNTLAALEPNCYLTPAQWEKKGGYEDKVSKWPLSMCNRYTDAQSAICPHCFPECTGEAGVQCQVSVFSANAGVTRPSRPAATRVLPVRH